ncbi:hypothetical protein [Streptomyces sp. DSM 41534]
MAPSCTLQGPSAVVCDHHYETRTRGGEPIAIRVCTLCHRPDWDDLAIQAEEQYRKGWEAGRAVAEAYAYVPPAARHLPKDALDAATRGADMLDACALTPDGRNFLAHALVQLRRDGWLRDEAQPQATPIPEDAEATSDAQPAPVNSLFPFPATGFRDYLVDAAVAFERYSYEGSGYDHDFDEPYTRRNAEALIDQAIHGNTTPKPSDEQGQT